MNIIEHVLLLAFGELSSSTHKLKRTDVRLYILLGSCQVEIEFSGRITLYFVKTQ